MHTHLLKRHTKTRIMLPTYLYILFFRAIMRIFFSSRLYHTQLRQSAIAPTTSSRLQTRIIIIVFVAHSSSYRLSCFFFYFLSNFNIWSAARPSVMYIYIYSLFRIRNTNLSCISYIDTRLDTLFATRGFLPGTNEYYYIVITRGLIIIIIIFRRYIIWVRKKKHYNV